MLSLKLAKAEVAALAVAAAELGTAALIWGRPPTPPVPAHFGLNGNVDRWASAQEMALWIAGGAALGIAVVAALGWAARRLDASDQRRRGLRMGQAVTVAVFFGIAMLHAGLTLGVGGGKLPVVILCLILAVIGAALGRVPPNALVGVRTPWSLSSRLAWDRSNRLAGRLFLAVGLIGLALAMVVDRRASMTLVTVSVLAAAAASAFESWRVWRTDPERRLV